MKSGTDRQTFILIGWVGDPEIFSFSDSLYNRLFSSVSPTNACCLDPSAVAREGGPGEPHQDTEEADEEEVGIEAVESEMKALEQSNENKEKTEGHLNEMEESETSV